MRCNLTLVYFKTKFSPFYNRNFTKTIYLHLLKKKKKNLLNITRLSLGSSRGYSDLVVSSNDRDNPEENSLEPGTSALEL